jgi:hypothetical protein
MSFKDMLGLFENKKPFVKSNLNASLQQGNNYNDMQEQLESSVVPQLSLIERTTQSNLGSVVENFSNSSETPLTKVNQQEYKMITKTENDFNKAISNLTAKHKALLLNPPKIGSVMVKWPEEDTMTNCSDYTKKSGVGPYKSKGGQYLAEACSSGLEGVDCNKHYSGGASWQAWQRTACSTGKQLKAAQKNKPASINDQLSGIYTEVNKRANVLKNQSYALHAQKTDLTGKSGVTTNQRKSLGTQLDKLKERENTLQKLETSGDTLQGELNDNTLQMNSQHLRYMIWFIAAVTLGLVAVKKSTQ